MKVRVVAYNGKIVIVPIEPEKDVGDDWFPMGRGHTGCVLFDTRRQLGVSEEALALLRTIRVSQDAVGDISWWDGADSELRDEQGKLLYGFSWLGSVYRVIDPATCEGASDYAITDEHLQHCTIIPNEVPEAAKAAIDQNPSTVAWAEPHDIPLS